MKKNLVSGTWGFFLVFVLAFSGCATSPETLSGSLTITGIPAEYNGKTIDSYRAYEGKNAEGKKWTVTGNDAVDPKAAAAISNGEATLGVYTKGPVDTAGFTADLMFDIHDPSHPNKSYNASGGIYFKGVQFQNGSAQLNWDDGIKTGVVTIAGIPAEYNGGTVKNIRYNANLFVGAALRMGTGGLSGALGSSPTPSGTEMNVGGDIVDGKLELPLWVPVADPEKFIGVVSVYKPFTENVVKDVMLVITTGTQDTSTGGVVVSRAIAESYLFKAVPFTNGNATISFFEGVKQ